jgi:hypothetical protein
LRSGRVEDDTTETEAVLVRRGSDLSPEGLCTGLTGGLQPKVKVVRIVPTSSP